METTATVSAPPSFGLMNKSAVVGVVLGSHRRVQNAATAQTGRTKTPPRPSPAKESNPCCLMFLETRVADGTAYSTPRYCAPGLSGQGPVPPDRAQRVLSARSCTAITRNPLQRRSRRARFNFRQPRLRQVTAPLPAHRVRDYPPACAVHGPRGNSLHVQLLTFGIRQVNIWSASKPAHCGDQIRQGQ